MTKIYFAGAISAGRELQPVYQAMVDFIHECGGEVLSAHVAKAEVLTGESKLTESEIFSRNLKFIIECDAMVAEVTKPSLGVGFEISEALHRNKPVICFCQKGVFLTRMLTGNPSSNLSIHFYEQQQWQKPLEDFLQALRNKKR
jgi:nucleoside 2-deoxyribosyltransferase